MQYGFLPFNATRDAGGQDIRHSLRERKRPFLKRLKGISNLQMLDVVADQLQALPYKICVDFCHESKGDLQLAVYGPDLGRDIESGDRVNAGVYIANSESGRFETTFCERIFRMSCVNGTLVETERSQSRVIATRQLGLTWKRSLREVVCRSFDNEGVDADLAMFRKTIQEMVTSPYEILCNLVSQGLIDESEQSEIDGAFQKEADFSMYGLINAITSVSHALRSNDNWVRAMDMERLGGEILRGDHRIRSYRFAPV